MALSRRARRDWVRMLPEVYATTRQLDFADWILAACLWSKGVASHRAAARLHGLDGADDGPLEVTVPVDRNPRCRKVRVHRCNLETAEKGVARGIPVTTVERTLVDLAAVVPFLPLAKAVESAWRQRMIDPPQLLYWLGEVETRRHGLKALRRILNDCARRARPLDSALEVEFWWLLNSEKMPLPVPGYSVSDDFGQPMRVDFAYPRERVAVETNGRQFHGDAQFERDNARLSRLGAAHWCVMHVTQAQLRSPKRVLALLGQALRGAPSGSISVEEAVRRKSP
jgi:very-short-patch-repair endonuclease